ncbi:MAG TPA: tRNA 2-thiouridine(34) synthase MnmA [Rhabdochlamydiaceae bacterium]|nr:tRNA 2-thiouridine(34) synthase MnmA [Rhabdochlamydiaceae bacterium]
MHRTQTVVLGMSGGVDSSVAAFLLKEQGYKVVGLFMKNWEETDNSGICNSVRDFEDVVSVCNQLDIPYYSVNFVKEYEELVFNEFLQELRLGHTPNPDILCNREIKFKVFLEKAMQLGADFLATGHYAQKDQMCRLLKGKDPGKDQSYFLYTLSQEVLQKVLFPIGSIEKTQVREIAKKLGLTTHDKKDSTGICFIGKRDFKEFVSQYIPYQKGYFETLKGDIVGEHEGAAYYTIGQRKGMGIGGPGEAWFVVKKDIARNVVIVEQGSDHPALYSTTLRANNISWVSAQPKLPFACKAKIRYRQTDQDCLIEKIEGDRLFVSFKEPQRAVTARQSIVFYDGDICLGGAMIE